MTALLNIAANFTEVIAPISTILGSMGAVIAGWTVVSSIRRSDDAED